MQSLKRESRLGRNDGRVRRFVLGCEYFAVKCSFVFLVLTRKKRYGGKLVICFLASLQLQRLNQIQRSFTADSLPWLTISTKMTAAVIKMITVLIKMFEQLMRISRSSKSRPNYHYIFFSQAHLQLLTISFPLPHNQLLAWIKKKVPWLEDRSTDNTLAGCQKKLEEFRNYRFVG